jgi:hypothetical protein
MVRLAQYDLNAKRELAQYDLNAKRERVRSIVLALISSKIDLRYMASLSVPIAQRSEFRLTPEELVKIAVIIDNAIRNLDKE